MHPTELSEGASGNREHGEIIAQRWAPQPWHCRRRRWSSGRPRCWPRRWRGTAARPLSAPPPLGAARRGVGTRRALTIFVTTRLLSRRENTQQLQSGRSQPTRSQPKLGLNRPRLRCTQRQHGRNHLLVSRNQPCVEQELSACVRTIPPNVQIQHGTQIQPKYRRTHRGKAKPSLQAKAHP